MCPELDYLFSDAEDAASAQWDAPRTIERSPRNLIEEARRAFDAGLLISCLTVLVTIPDVCAHLIGTSRKNGQRNWCIKYLGFPGDPVVDDIDRSREQSRDRIEQTMDALMREDNFTASDFCQLRNAVLHAGSSVVDGAGAKYSPFHSIGMQVFDDDNRLVVGYGVTSSPGSNGVEGDCRIKITLNLTALLARMEKAVARFLSEYPELDRENGKWDCLTWGIVDFRTSRGAEMPSRS
ncbi:hypothetical protein [Parafannyhessea umbonata]|uniref:hypothetical protein n=1 Tax=Parafannyhessea umbonata TaxID=604330 RepID=UPI00359C56FA